MLAKQEIGRTGDMSLSRESALSHGALLVFAQQK
jgi:hypothetical protein